MNVETDDLDPWFSLCERVSGDDRHSERNGPARDRPADPSETDQTDRQASERTGQGSSDPVSGTDGLVVSPEILDESKEQGEGLLGHALMVRPWGDRDDDISLRRGRDVDRVETDAGPGDHPELRRFVHDRGGDRFSTGDDRLAAWKPFKEVGHPQHSPERRVDDRETGRFEECPVSPWLASDGLRPDQDAGHGDHREIEEVRSDCLERTRIPLASRDARTRDSNRFARRRILTANRELRVRAYDLFWLVLPVSCLPIGTTGAFGISSPRKATERRSILRLLTGKRIIARLCYSIAMLALLLLRQPAP
jgi:hypothetical protein